MAIGDEIHFRLLYLVTAVAVLVLLRKPLRYPDKPGSRWFALTIVSVSTWLAGVGLYYFARDIVSALALYSLVLFSVTVCFVGWILIAVEFATGRSPPPSIRLALAAFAAIHFVLLATNFFGVHELLYRSTTFVDLGGGLNVHRGPFFWVHIVLVYVLVFLSTVLFVAEWANSSGLRKRQAGILAITPIFGVATSLLWFAEVLPFPFDPTPVGVTVGVVLLGWALYRTEFLEIVPIASHAVVEKMTDAVVIVDEGDRVVNWNAAARDLFGAGDAPVGTPVEEFFDPVPPETIAQLSETRRTDTQVSFEIDGRVRHFSVSISPIETDDSGLLGRAVIVKDITDIKQREEQLLKQNEYLDQFAEIVSHDLQGPLMAIRGNADVAVETGDVSHVEHVLDATDRIEQLIDDLLRLARTGRQVEDVEPVELADVAQSAWRRVWSANAEHAIDTDHTVLADPDRLQQLFENLFWNSVQHGSTDANDGDARGVAGPDDSAATPTATGTDDRIDGVRIAVGSLPDGFYVEDDGPGIAPDERDRVFERGYTTADDGTGLGLGIVRQIAGAHGWSVRATEGTDGGARFEITGVTVENAE